MLRGNGYFSVCKLRILIVQSQHHMLIIYRAILGTCVFTPLWFLLPPEIPVDRHGRIDWIGAGLGTSGLIVFNFVWK